MKAAYIEKFGGPEVLTYGDLPDPVAGPGQVVVDVVAASVNGADPKVAAGDYKQTKFPLILGRDFSGKVSAVGEGVTDLKVGDDVFGVLETGRDGTYCEKIAVGANVVAKKPAGLSHVDAAAMALTGLTAICAVENSLQLKRGETILIQGGAGGVAAFAIQLAKHIGARVISTCSTGNLDYVRGLGADEVIDYRAERFEQRVLGVDVVFDTVGGDTLRRSWDVLRPGGRLVTIAASEEGSQDERTRAAFFIVEPRRAELEEVARLIDSGEVRPVVGAEFPLADALLAYRHKPARGKVVLRVGDDARRALPGY